MAKKYFEKDTDMKYLEGKIVAVIGYGNQGRSQALNLRDSGVSLIVGSPRKDPSESRAKEDGFEVYTIDETIQHADVLMVMLPDEALPKIYETKIKPYLRKGQVLSFASGYNLFFNKLDIPAFIDVVMLAPRMIGREVRSLYEEGKGAPCLISVEQDASGNAMGILLAISKGIGATRSVAIESNAQEETLIDLMGEQALGGSLVFFTNCLFECLVDAGCSPESVLLEIYASGENIAVANAIVEKGLLEQLKFHSNTSQYGQQTRGPRLVSEETKNVLHQMINDIQDGSFCKEWTKVQEDGMREFDEVWANSRKMQIFQEEDKLYKLLGRR